jgi:elongation factor Ts
MESVEELKQLRDETGVSISECKKALDQSGGDVEKAKEILRKSGQDLAGKKSSREANQGIIESYVHANRKVGVLLDLRTETDFVAKSDEFKDLAHEICLQIAAMSPWYVKEEDIPEEISKKEEEIYKEQLKDSDKPAEILENVIKGKIEKRKKEISLLSQPWVKDTSKTIKNLIEEKIAKIGENIVVEKFIRYEI